MDVPLINRVNMGEESINWKIFDLTRERFESERFTSEAFCQLLYYSPRLRKKMIFP